MSNGLSGLAAGVDGGVDGYGAARSGTREFLAIKRIATGTFARYVAASAVALGADTGSFLIMLHFAVAPALAAAIGFMLGTVVHWLVSSQVMFRHAVAAPGPERRAQMVLFVASALLGLALTTLIVGGAVMLAINPRLAKLVAIAASFTTTSGLRHLLVFGKSRSL